MGAKHAPTCPYCGQDIVIPNEVTRLPLEPKVRTVLLRLYRHRNYVVGYEMFHLSLGTLRCYISTLRDSLKDTGLGWTVVNMSGRGYLLIVPSKELGDPVVHVTADGAPPHG